MKDQIILKTKTNNRYTQIYIGINLMKDPPFIDFCKKISCRLAIITDSHVGKYYGQSLLIFLQENDIDVTLHIFEAGEKSKSRLVKATLEDELFSAGHGRDSCFIAMGGGITTDLVGFISATFCRGVPYLSIPTSLLAMVDASIGGKTGINVPYGKNLLGATHHPLAIFIDLSILHTLSEKGMKEGASEIIKHGLIAHCHLFRMIQENLKKWNERDPSFLRKIIYESIQIKKKIVEIDPYEKGMRRMLNFGHTIGHAIETLENYQLSHGEAVAIGMLIEGFISFKLKKIKESELDEIYQVLRAVGYKLSVSEQVTSQKMLEVMSYDKKAKRKTPRFVILDGIGKVEPFKESYCTEINEIILSEALGWLIAEFYRDTNGPLSY